MDPAQLTIVVVLWAVVGLGVFIDAGQRIANGTARRLVIALALAVPFAGAFLYWLFRPSETVGERRRRRRLGGVFEELARLTP